MGLEGRSSQKDLSASIFAGHGLDGETLKGILRSIRVPWASAPDEVEGRREFGPEKTLCRLGSTETEAEIDVRLRVLPHRESCVGGSCNCEDGLLIETVCSCSNR